MADGFRPPPYPYERLGALAALAASAPGGLVDCSVGTPCDPVPQAARDAGAAALQASSGYPPSIGSAELRDAAAGWLNRRFGTPATADDVAVCVGTKELVASLPHHLRLRDPSRDTVLYPAVSYPTYEMGAVLAGCRPVAVPLDGEWHLDLGAISDEDADRALLLWVNEPGNPTASVAPEGWFADVARFGAEHGVVVASDECYVEFAPRPDTITCARTQGVLAVHSVSKRSNLAGARVGFYTGDPELVGYLREVRKHAGLMVPTALQAAAAAALRDDGHVDRQRAEYEYRRALVLDALGPAGFEHTGGPMAFYLWLRAADRADGWVVAERLARTGLLVAPGDLYGAAGSDHVRLALVQPTDRLELAAQRITKEYS
jgi:succinyldiaminopimelate transaminase